MNSGYEWSAASSATLPNTAGQSAASAPHSAGDGTGEMDAGFHATELSMARLAEGADRRLKRVMWLLWGLVTACLIAGALIWWQLLRAL